MANDTITATRRIQFCAGHRVYGHEGKCAQFHGHNYVVLVTAKAAKLDPVGRVIDFAALKHLVGGWIEDHWDHGFIVYEFDIEARAVLAQVMGQKIYVMPTNPTAENMATHLLDVVGRLLAPKGIELVRVVVWETENCFAEATR